MDDLAPFVVDDLRNFTSGFEVCCNSAPFLIAPTMFICRFYNAIYIYVSCQLHIKMFIPIHAAMYIHCRSSFCLLKECMACFQSLNIYTCCFFRGLVVDSVL